MPDGAAAFGRTIPELLAWRAPATPEGAAFQFRAAVDDRWQLIIWAEHQVAVGRMARGLAGRGLHPGARMGILAPTSIRWEIARMASLARGAVVVNIDLTYPDERLPQILHEVSLIGLCVRSGATFARLDNERLQQLNFVGCLCGRRTNDDREATSFVVFMRGEGVLGARTWSISRSQATAPSCCSRRERQETR